jgi:hypothetical protein
MRFNSGVLGRVSVATAVLAASLAIATASPTSADAAGWQGLAVSQLKTSHGSPVPGWGIAVTEDLGGPGVDVWNNNHGNMSEAVVDLTSGGGTVRTALHYGETSTNGPDSHGAAFSDIDGDGDEDLFEVSGRNNTNRLFRNDNGVLSKIPVGNLGDTDGRGRQPLFLDFDSDGDMDVLITNLDRRDIDGVFRPSELYLNNGNGTSWTKVADPSEVLSDGHVRIASMTSTGPGTPQIVATHDVFTIAKDSIAVGSGTFAEPSNPAIVRNTPSRPVREVIVGDFDGDLHPEFIAFMGNESAGGFDMQLSAFEVSSAGSARTVSLPQMAVVDNCRSGAAADFDNDGDLDILAGCAQKQEGQNRNVLLLNDGQGNFTDGGTGVLPAAADAETPSAIVTADVNADGWMDAVMANGYDDETAVDHVLTNKKGTSAHWLEIDLTGSNPDVAGAQVFVGSNVWQVRETGHRYHRSQDGRTLHFGLGAQTQIAKVEIQWPDGIYQSCTVSGIDRRVTIVKGSNSCEGQTKAGLLATLAASPDTAPGTPPPPPVKTCAGVPVTVDISKGQTPTNGNDVILGTMTANAINALGGDDLICGLGGNDVIFGGGGKDTIYAGAGNDEIWGGALADRIRGGTGNDIVRGGDGWDWLFGNDGRDQVIGGNGVDRLRGGNGIDRLDGGPMIDYCAGGKKVNCERRH